MDWTGWDSCNRFAIGPLIFRMKHLALALSSRNISFCTYNSQSGYSENSWKFDLEKTWIFKRTQKIIQLHLSNYSGICIEFRRRYHHKMYPNRWTVSFDVLNSQWESVTNFFLLQKLHIHFTLNQLSHFKTEIWWINHNAYR